MFDRVLNTPLLTHFLSLNSFYTPRKYQKTKGFLMFSGGIERGKWHKMSYYRIISNFFKKLINKFQRVPLFPTCLFECSLETNEIPSVFIPEVLCKARMIRFLGNQLTRFFCSLAKPKNELKIEKSQTHFYSCLWLLTLSCIML